MYLPPSSRGLRRLTLNLETQVRILPAVNIRVYREGIREFTKSWYDYIKEAGGHPRKS
jgi:hypothetical protein